MLATYLLRRASRRFVAWSLSTAEKKRAVAGQPVSSDDRLRLEERAATIRKVLVSLGNVLIWTVAGLLILAELGINLAPLIAAAGVAGIAIGLGAQTLVRDYLAGLFILMENQLGIGDDVDLSEASGIVESLTLRTTTLRDRDGTLWYVPNGEVSWVAHHSQIWSRALVDLRVSYGADLARVKSVIRRLLDEMHREPEWSGSFLDEPGDPTVQDLAADAVVVRVSARVRREDLPAVDLELRERVKRALDDEQIEMQLPQQVVWLRR